MSDIATAQAAYDAAAEAFKASRDLAVRLAKPVPFDGDFPTYHARDAVADAMRAAERRSRRRM